MIGAVIAGVFSFFTGTATVLYALVLYRLGNGIGRLVNETYGAYLHHGADQGSINNFVVGLNSGALRFSDLPVSVLDSDEFFGNAAANVP